MLDICKCKQFVNAHNYDPLLHGLLKRCTRLSSSTHWSANYTPKNYVTTDEEPMRWKPVRVIIMHLGQALESDMLVADELFNVGCQWLPRTNTRWGSWEAGRTLHPREHLDKEGRTVRLSLMNSDPIVPDNSSVILNLMRIWIFPVATWFIAVHEANILLQELLRKADRQTSIQASITLHRFRNTCEQEAIMFC